MLSIHNFYWLMFENLLRPSGLDCWYHYPFGTRDNLSKINEFQIVEPKKQHHVLFYHDQEPVWTQDLGKLYDNIGVAWSQKICKILANSERSHIKKQICQDRGMLDWYFFFHGFAALDWFRDSQFLDTDATPTKVFSSLNHLVRDKKAYRMAITAKIFSRNLQHYGDISLHADKLDLYQELASANTLLSTRDRDAIKTELLCRDCWPLVLDQSAINGNYSAHFGHREYKVWQNSFVHLVNETVFYDRKLHLTEKIFKPIVSARPFLLAASPGNLAYLKSYGFKTFDHWWSEDYDLVQDNDERTDMIVDIIQDLCAKSPAELIEVHREMQPILDYNKKHFFGEFRRIIVHELVENFDICIRTWNNGRVDNRELPLPSNLQSVKQVLLR